MILASLFNAFPLQKILLGSAVHLNETQNESVMINQPSSMESFKEFCLHVLAHIVGCVLYFFLYLYVLKPLTTPDQL